MPRWLMTFFTNANSAMKNIFHLIYLFIPIFLVINNVIHGPARFVCQIISRIIIIKQPSVDMNDKWWQAGMHALQWHDVKTDLFKI